MTSRPPTLVAVFAVTAAIAPLVASDDDGQAASPKADHGSAELVECSRGRQSKDRRATFRGEMRQLSGSDAPPRMQMRFALYERVGRGPWEALDAPGIGVWREARPGIVRFAYRQRVVALQKGTSYRARVVFRWLSTDGSVVRRASERSPVCRQPGKLPNLEVGDSIAVEPGPAEDTRRYTAKVANTGRVGARRVQVVLLVDGAEVDTRTIGRLNVGARRRVTFVGPPCTSQIEVRVDPDDAIRETTGRDNVVSTSCPTG